MDKIEKRIKFLFAISGGIVCGIISTFWCGYHILTAGNLMSAPDTYHHKEAESLQPYGFIGLVIYVICLAVLLLSHFNFH